MEVLVFILILLILGLVVLAIAIAVYFVMTQRKLVSLDELCKNALSQIEVQLMGRMNVVFERYPELKASELYVNAQQGQKEYEENVRMSRMVYNDTATKMNRMVRQWPSSIVASMLHFGEKEYLKVDDEKKRAFAK